MLKRFLSEIAPYVVVVGSFARREETLWSDIDCFLRSRPVNEVDPEKGDDTYMPEILSVIDRFGFRPFMDSVIMGHVAVEQEAGISRMVEISSHYKIPANQKVFYRDIEGVPMMCAVDDKDADWSKCYDSVDWDDSLCDNVIRYPLPKFRSSGEHDYDVREGGQ